tara:strand:+ start:404 stop:604 length:201 start_codon:yes stop_codon:yes gene_type:complete
MCHIKKRRIKMAESKTTKDMKAKLDRVTNRISTIVDELEQMKLEMNTFKEAVANDMRRLVKRTNKK